MALEQQEAIRQAITSKVLVITGGPGTGKTTLVNGIIKILAAKGRKILLAAPTGRAAKRMTETTGCESKTVHRLLEFSPPDHAFKRDQSNPLDADVVVLDETSMLDTVLANSFLKAVPAHAQLILVGDVDRCPPWGRETSFRHHRVGCCPGGSAHPHLPPGGEEPDCGQRPPGQPGRVSSAQASHGRR